MGMLHQEASKFGRCVGDVRALAATPASRIDVCGCSWREERNRDHDGWWRPVCRFGIWLGHCGLWIKASPAQGQPFSGWETKDSTNNGPSKHKRKPRLKPTHNAVHRVLQPPYFKKKKGLWGLCCHLLPPIFRRLMRSPCCLSVYPPIFRRLMRSPCCLSVYPPIFLGGLWDHLAVCLCIPQFLGGLWDHLVVCLCILQFF
jgi:hypothetical protein